MAYEVDGQVHKAVALLEHVVEVEEKTLAPEHPQRLASQHALAGACQADGQVHKAVALLEHVVGVEEKTLAPEHPDRLASQHELAVSIPRRRTGAQGGRAAAARGGTRTRSEHTEADGQVHKAVALLEHVVEVEEKTLAPEHPDRLASQHVLAMAYQADGQVHKAVALLEHVVEVEEKTLAPEHPDRLASQHVLAMAYQADGQVHKAVGTAGARGGSRREDAGARAPRPTGVAARTRTSIPSRRTGAQGGRAAAARGGSAREDAGGQSTLTTGVAARARRSIPSRRTGAQGGRVVTACRCGRSSYSSRRAPFAAMYQSKRLPTCLLS
ncbi:unnamed protein product [Alternaria alternata]